MFLYSQKQLSRVDSDVAVHTSSGILDGNVLVVYRQPMALDRFTAHDVTAAEPIGKCKSLMTCRYQIIYVHGYIFCERPEQIMMTTDVEFSKCSINILHMLLNSYLKM